MITIIGATGNTGKAVAEQLLKSGEKIRALGRSADKLKSLVDQGAEIMIGDTTDAAYLTTAFRGADAVYTLLPDDFQSTDHRAFQDKMGEAITKAIRESGVKHVVFVSSLGADLSDGTGLIAALHAQEARLRTLIGVNVLVFRCGWFFENFFGSLGLIKHQGINGGAIAPDVRMAMIAGRDIAVAAAKALKQRDFSGFVVRELLGERHLTFAEATRILGARLGKPELPYVQFSYADMTKAFVQMGFSQNVAELFVEMSRAFNEGKIKSLEGRSPANTTPTRFEAFADELAKAYQAM